MTRVHLRMPLGEFLEQAFRERISADVLGALQACHGRTGDEHAHPDEQQYEDESDDGLHAQGSSDCL